MQVLEVNNKYKFSNGIAFGAKFPNFKAAKTPDAIVSLNGDLLSQLTSIVGAFENIHSGLRALHIQKENPSAQKFFNEITSELGIKEVLESKSEGISFVKGVKNVFISTQGRNSLHIKEVDAKTGNVEKSLFFYDGKLVKPNVKNEYSNILEYAHYEDIDVEKFEEDVQSKFDYVDFSLLKVRKRLLNPEVQAEVNKIDPFTIKAQVNKSFIVNQEEVKPPTPKKELKSYYQRMLEQQRAQRAVKEYKPKVTVMQSGVKATEIKEKRVVKTTDTFKKQEKKDLPVIETVSKRRGRPRKDVNLSENKEVKLTRRNLFPQSKKGLLEGENLSMVSELRDTYNEIYERIHSVGNSITRSKIKNSYGAPLNKGVAGSRVLEFEGIGPDSETFSINVFNYQGKPHLVLNKKSSDGQVETFFINPKGQVMKKPPLVMDRKNIGPNSSNKVDYYTQDELDEISLERKFEPLREQLKLYKEHINSKIEALNNKKEWTSTPENVGSLSSENDLIAEISQKYEDYKSVFSHINPIKRAKVAKILGLETRRGNPSIVMRNVGENSENIHLSFPIFEGKKGVKIQILDENDEVKNVFYIMDDKLVKFDAGKNIHNRKHGDRKIHYHSQEYIDNSGLKNYLTLLNLRLSEANESLANLQQAKENKFMEKLLSDVAQKTEEVKKVYISQLQQNLTQFQTELSNRISETSSEISELTQKSLSQIQQDTFNAIETLKQKLAELLNQK